MNRIAELKKHYNLIPHEEGGLFAEIYTSSFNHDGRAYAGSIYYLLEKDEISHFHVLDSDEIWYFHEGTGMKITAISEEGVKEYYLGNNIDNNEEPMVLLETGEIFAAENIDKDAYSFVSCMTCPGFTYEGYRIVYEDEIRKLSDDERILSLAYKRGE